VGGAIAGGPAEDAAETDSRCVLASVSCFVLVFWVVVFLHAREVRRREVKGRRATCRKTDPGARGNCGTGSGGSRQGREVRVHRGFEGRGFTAGLRRWPVSNTR